MKTPEQIRIETKLKLWDTPGFFQFIDDVKSMTSYYNDLSEDVGIMRDRYIQKLKELEPEYKFKQGKLDI